LLEGIERMQKKISRILEVTNGIDQSKIFKKFGST